MRLKLRKHSAAQSEPRRNKSRFPGRSARKRPTLNTAAKKRVDWADVDFDCLFVNLPSALVELSIRKLFASDRGLFANGRKSVAGSAADEVSVLALKHLSWTSSMTAADIGLFCRE